MTTPRRRILRPHQEATPADPRQQARLKRKRAVAAVSPQSPSNASSISTDADQAGKNPAAAFGPNEWLVDEIYQQYLQDPNSVERGEGDYVDHKLAF